MYKRQAQDKLAVVGIDKDIVSISVTTGHGTLQLSNTSPVSYTHLDVYKRQDYQYDAFGQRIAGQENIPNRLRYNAQIEDDLTGLYYLQIGRAHV